jgi:hypothetical protein
MNAFHYRHSVEFGDETAGKKERIFCEHISDTVGIFLEELI